jgi:hypothetical protein
VLTGAKIPHGTAAFGAYTIPTHIVSGQWVFGRAGANPGVGANWNLYPYTDWVGVILGNSDGAPLQEMSQREVQAVTGGSIGGSGGGSGG